MAKEKISYSSAITEITEIISEIENNRVDIDLLSEKVKRVSFLIEFCKTKLHDTEKFMENLLNENKDN